MGTVVHQSAGNQFSNIEIAVDGFLARMRALSSMSFAVSPLAKVHRTGICLMQGTTQQKSQSGRFSRFACMSSSARFNGDLARLFRDGRNSAYP